MANKKITDLSSQTSGGVDRAVDVLEIADVSANQSLKITPNALFGVSGAVVGDTDVQAISNKTLTSSTLTAPIINGTITGTYTLGGTPTFPATILTTTNSVSVTGKTLVSPTITTPTITNATITADAISGFSTANTGTIYGVSITVGAISVPSSLTVATTSTLTGAVSVGSTLATTGQLSVQTATAPPAAGASTAGIKMSSTANLGLFFGSGAPTFSAAQGSLYMRTDGSSTSTRMYINTNSSTTWTNVTTAA
jgi:hypothetical protein